MLQQVYPKTLFIVYSPKISIMLTNEPKASKHLKTNINSIHNIFIDTTTVYKRKNIHF